MTTKPLDKRTENRLFWIVLALDVALIALGVYL